MSSKTAVSAADYNFGGHAKSCTIESLIRTRIHDFQGGLFFVFFVSRVFAHFEEAKNAHESV